MPAEQSRQSKNWSRYVQEMLELDRFVNEDLAEAVEFFRFGTRDFAIRTFVRTMAAEFETRLFLLQDFMLKLHEETSNIKFTPEELAVLKSESYVVRANGEVQSSVKFYPFKEHLLFTLKLFARRFNVKAMPDTSGSGWQAVQAFIEIRNRLMHPKSMRDLVISEAEVTTINEAQDWLRGAFKSLFSPELVRGMKSPKIPREKDGA
jgi:hypothetical protein